MGTVLLATADTASAQGSPPPWAPNGLSQDGSAIGGLTFFDANGNPITGGPISSAPFAKYTEGRVQVRNATWTDTKATLYAYQPQVGQTPDQWTNNDQIGLSTSYPNSAAPAPLNTATLPVNTGNTTDKTLNQVTVDFPSTSTTTGYVNAYEIRMYTGAAGHPQSTTYDYADITVNPSTGQWALVYTPDGGPTSSSLTAAPSPANTGQTVTLSAQETQTTPVATGSYQFNDNGTPIGSPVPVDGTGKATTTTSWSTPATHSLTAVFTPTNAAYTGSTGSFSEVVQNAPSPTTTTLAISGSTQYTGSDIKLNASVTAADSTFQAGSVSFYDNGSTTPLGTVSTTVTAASDTATLDEPSGLGVGSHSVVATFTPSSTAYTSSSSQPQTFSSSAPLQGACTQSGSQCQTTGNVQTSVPVGTLVITTPYTPTAPLIVPALTLQTNATEYKGSAPIANIAVTDTRAGNLPWAIQAVSSNLSDGGGHANSVINSQDVGLTGLTGTASGGFAGTVTPADNPAADPAVGPTAPLGATGHQGLGLNPHTIASATAGMGTYTLNGTLTITAPTSTEPGTFNGTITFTVG